MGNCNSNNKRVGNKRAIKSNTIKPSTHDKNDNPIIDHPITDIDRNHVLYQFNSIAQFLLTTSPQDILMPVAVGAKSPLMCHSSGRWSWHRLYEFIMNQDKDQKYDACVLLRRLCVVDVDNVKLATELETRFPELKKAPCEKTSQGYHYWFWRSIRADVDGYYDGASQRIKGVDFKSICRTGTSGVVVIPPSKNKVWTREIGKCGELIPIPDALLAEIAIPQHTRIPIRCQFTDSLDGNPSNTLGTELVDSGFLSACEYFEPFMDDATTFASNGMMGEEGGSTDVGGDTVVIPVPTNVHTFRTLTEHIIPDRLETAQLDDIFAAHRLCDKLGYRSDMIAQLIANGSILWRIDLKNNWPNAFNADEIERLWFDTTFPNNMHRTKDHIDISTTTNIDTRMFQPVGKHEIKYIGIVNAPHLALFCNSNGEIERHGRPDIGSIIVRQNNKLPELFEHSIPKRVATFMKKWPGIIVLAGGAVLGHVVTKDSNIAPGNDYDLFVVTKSESIADAVARSFVNHFKDQDSRINDVFRTSRAWTVRMRNHSIEKDKDKNDGWTDAGIDDYLSIDYDTEDDDIKEFTQVQMILRLYDDPRHVFAGFDLAPTRIGAWIDSETGLMRIEATASWFECMSRLSFVPQPHCWSNASVFRISKYIAKGFDAFLPGMRREAMSRHVDKQSNSAIGLFFVERLMRRINNDDIAPTCGNPIKLVLNKRKQYDTCPPKPEDIPSLANKLRHTSEYDTMLAATRRIWHAVKQLVSGGNSSIINILPGPPKGCPVWPHMPMWHRFTGCSMSPYSARLSSIHDLNRPMYDRIAREAFLEAASV